jgi:hypothetical protein
MSRSRYVLAAAAALALVVPVASPAAAADRRAEAAAKDALKKAANDYLATDYVAGATRLERALRTCGRNKCTAATKAALLRDLGTMQFRNGDVGAAKKTWGDALKLQPQITLNPDYDTPDLRSAFDDAKGGAGGGGPQPSGDFAHTAVAEQKVNTPLPVYAEYPGTLQVARVIVKYKGATGADWSRVDLKRSGNGWGGVIPCGDVTRGTMSYWIQGFDDGGDPVAASGDPKHPYTVPIKDDIAGEAPHLPGKPAPKSCSEGDSDCPPGLPGCGGEKESSGGEGEGESSEGESEAESEKGRERSGNTYARFWVGVSAELPEFLQMPGGDDLCKLTPTGLPANSANMYCTNPDGSDFPSRVSPVQNGHLSIQGQAGHADGGFTLGDVRVMAALDYALSPSFLIGGRLGYVFNAYTGQSAASAGRALGPKIHAEARATYLFGHEPLMHAGFAPMVFLGTGISEFDAHVMSVVTLDNVAGQQPVNIWITDAPFFVAVGGGIRYQFSLRSAFTAAARVNAVIGGNGFMTTYGPEVGILYGF